MARQRVQHMLHMLHMLHSNASCHLLTIHKSIVGDVRSHPGRRPASGQRSWRGKGAVPPPRSVSRGVHVKAWQFIGDGMPLTGNDVAEPVLREDWVIVWVMGTGLCHTDVAFIDGDIPSS